MCALGAEPFPSAKAAGGPRQAWAPLLSLAEGLVALLGQLLHKQRPRSAHRCFVLTDLPSDALQISKLLQVPFVCLVEATWLRRRFTLPVMLAVLMVIMGVGVV